MKENFNLKVYGLFMWVMTTSFLSTQAQSAQFDIAENGSFEIIEESNGLPSGWVYDDNVTFAVVTEESNVNEGEKAIKLTGAVYGASYGISQTVNVTPGTLYNFSFDYAYTLASNSSSTEAGVNYELIWQDNDGVAINALVKDEDLMFNLDALIGSSLLNTYLPFVGIESDITAPEGATKLKIAIGVNYSAACLIDNVHILSSSTSTGVESVKLTPVKVYKQGGVLKVETQVGEMIKVYNTCGVLMQQIKATSDIETIESLPQNQLLIVRIGNNTAKIVM